MLNQTDTRFCVSMRLNGVRFFLFSFFVFLACLHQSVYSQWISNPKAKHLFGGRDDGVALILGNKIFAGTGMDDGFQIYSDWSSYDINTNTWKVLNKPPFESRQYASATVINETIFLFGGYLSQNIFFNDVWKYSPQNDTWQACQNAAFSPRWASSALAFGNISYLACGRDTAKAFNDFWAYYPDSDSWQQLPDFPGEPRFNATFTSFQGHLYLGFGQNTQGEYFNDMYVYSPLNNTWSSEAIYFPETRSRARAAVLGNSILFFNGRTNGGNPVSTYTVYQANGETQSFPSPFPVFSGFQLMQQNAELWLLWGLVDESTRSDALIHYRLEGLDAKTTRLKLFPNPGSHRVILAGLDEKLETNISVHTLSGILKTSKKANKVGDVVFDTSTWEKGVYIFKIEDMNTAKQLFWVCD